MKGFSMQMKFSAGWAVLGIIAFLGLVAWSSYNGLVTKDEAVNAGWSEVQSQFKRRADLIPNLVKTVQGYAAHEKSVFENVTAARSQVSRAINVDVSKLAGDPQLQKQLLDASQALNSSLSRLIAVAESYPQLKANENFSKLQDELSGTENRIAVARGRAIKATQAYNRAIRAFPSNLIAGLGRFERKNYYEAPEKDQQVPQVEFGKS